MVIAALALPLTVAAFVEGRAQSPFVEGPVPSFVEGPFPGMTGGFGEPSCHQCHFDNRIGEPSGRLTVSGVPRTYVPGARYTLKIALRRPGLSRGGFQIAARFASGPLAGAQAGALAPADDRVQVVRDPARPAIAFAQHTVGGTRAPRAGDLEWIVRWVAPDKARDPVVFHVAANAANDDASPLGDFIYVGEARSAPAPARKAARGAR